MATGKCGGEASGTLTGCSADGPLGVAERLPGYGADCGLSSWERGVTVSAEATAGSRTATPFDDLGDFVAIPRIGALRLAPDGSWLAAAIQTLSADGKKYLTSMWRIDPQGGQARRLTRSAEGEANPRFLPDGSPLFTSKRPDPGADKARQDGTASDGASLWLLPAGEGEARPIARLPGGIAAAGVASQAGTIVVSSPVLPAAGREGQVVPPAGGSPGGRAPGDSASTDDARLRKERADAGVTAILHESSPVRFWDHDLGPDQLRLFAVEPGEVAETGAEIGRVNGHKAAESSGVRDLTPEPGRALDDEAFELTPDGTSVLTGWWLWNPAGQSHSDLVTIDVATGKRRVLLSAPEFNFSDPRVSPAGRWCGCPPAARTHRTRLASRAVTCCPAWTAGRTSRPGRRIPARCTSSPTTTAGGRCSGPRWRPAPSPASPATTAPTPTSTSPGTAGTSTRSARRWHRRQRPSAST